MARSGSRSSRKRSLAAKKGWATRRRNNPILAAKHADTVLKKKAVRARKRDPQTNVIYKQAMIKMLTDAGIKLPKRISRSRLDDIVADFVGLKEQRARAETEAALLREREKRKSAEASFSTIANRAVTDTILAIREHAAPVGWVEDDYQIIRTRMSLADQFGDPSEEAERLAEEFEMHPREIFTIWLSP